MLARQLFVNKPYTEFDTNQTNRSDAVIVSPKDRGTHGRTDGHGIYVRLFLSANRLQSYFCTVHAAVIVYFENPTKHIKQCVVKIRSLY